MITSKRFNPLRMWMLLLLSLFFFSHVMAEEPYQLRQKNQVLNVGMTYFTDNLDPIVAWNFQEMVLNRGLYRPLLKVTDDGAFRPDLARTWDVEPDGKTYTFYLDPTARFEDGTPVLASDVAWSVSRHFWPNPDSNNEDYLDGILVGSDSVATGQIVPGIEVMDDHTIKFKLKQFSSFFLYSLAGSEVGALPQDRFKGHSPIASGDVRAKYDAEKQDWVLSREKSPAAGAPNQLRRIEVSRVKDEADALRRIENGELDIVMGLGTNEMKQMSLPEGFELKAIESLGSYDHFFYNMERPVFANREFRRDLSHLVQTAIRDFKDPTGITELLHTYLWEGILPTKYYEKKTVQEMFPESFKRKWPKSLSLKILLKYELLDSVTREQLTQALKKAGITLNWSRRDVDSYVKALKARDYDILFAGAIGFVWYPEVGIPPLDPKNPMRYCNGEMTEFFKKILEARSSLEKKERFQKYLEAFNWFENEYYFIPLSQDKLPVISRKSVSLRNHDWLSLWGFSWDTSVDASPN